VTQRRLLKSQALGKLLISHHGGYHGTRIELASEALDDPGFNLPSGERVIRAHLGKESRLASRVREGEISAAFPAGAESASCDKNAQHLHKQHLVCETSPTGSLCMHALCTCTAALRPVSSLDMDLITSGLCGTHEKPCVLYDLKSSSPFLFRQAQGTLTTNLPVA
jgi:hypothetical protein